MKALDISRMGVIVACVRARGDSRLAFGSISLNHVVCGVYTPAMGVMRFACFVSVLSLLAPLVGCVKVAPYERGTLAHPTMTTDEISIGLDAHVRAVSEGAAGGLGGGGGGCGCN
jgi:hypothetical protein